jgi:hypothetical protein
MAASPEQFGWPVGEVCHQRARCTRVVNLIKIIRRKQIVACPFVDDVDPRPMARSVCITCPPNVRSPGFVSGWSQSQGRVALGVRWKPEQDERVMSTGPVDRDGNGVKAVVHPEHDSCPQCGSAEIGTAFSKGDDSGSAVWECHCLDCRFKWSEKP